jgi:hypothetical protein
MMLRARRERPSNRRTAEQRDELAAPNSMTSSASASSLSGIWRLSALAGIHEGTMEPASLI